MILDTNVIIEFLRGKPKCVHFITSLENRYRLATTTINTFELLYGAYKFKKKEENILKIKRFLTQLEIYYFDLEASEEAGKLLAELSNQGLSLEIRDIFIAAIAIKNDLSLVTYNVKHFSRINRLKIIVSQ